MIKRKLVRLCVTVLSFSGLLFFSCDRPTELIRIEGEAQGTTYHITFRGTQNSAHEDIDSLLRSIDLSLSTYVRNSVISRINCNDSSVVADPYFITVFNRSQDVAKRTGGAFDITIAPIVNLYGFGFTKRSRVSNEKIDSTLQYVGYKLVRLNGTSVVKDKAEVMIDFNAIAQGYSVDLICDYLDHEGVKDYLVELGGEVKAKGTRDGSLPWRVGIDKPVENELQERQLQTVVQLKDRAMATSGNYRRFYEENGRKYSHIVDPLTGYPAKNNLLSATVFAGDCMTADAYATAFMVMGLDRTKEFLKENSEPGLDVFLVYDEQGVLKTFVSQGVYPFMENLD